MTTGSRGQAGLDSDSIYVTAYGQRIKRMLDRASKSPSLVEDFRSEVVAVLAGFGAEMPGTARNRLCEAVEAYDRAKSGCHGAGWTKGDLAAQFSTDSCTGSTGVPDGTCTGERTGASDALA